MTAAAWIVAGAVLAGLLGLVFILGGRGMRHRRGLGDGRTLALDDRTFFSRRYRLAGRPDRLVSDGGATVPEEWKSARQVRAWHRAQLGTYFLVIEEETGIRLTHGFIGTGDGTRHRVENTAELRAFVLEVAGQIRAARAGIRQPIPVRPVPGQCPPCGMLEHCGQARM